MMRDRRDAERRGRRAEIVALLLLRLKGYRILARRFRAAGGEIDLVARRGGVLVFAEVKTRVSIDAALASVSPRARRRIEAAGRSFIAARPRLAQLGVRYDIIAVAGLIARHLEDAWRGGE